MPLASFSRRPYMLFSVERPSCNRVSNSRLYSLSVGVDVVMSYSCPFVSSLSLRAFSRFEIRLAYSAGIGSAQ